MVKTTDRQRWKKIKANCKSINSQALTTSPLNSRQIISILKCSPHFIGCFAEDRLTNLNLLNYPVLLLTNVDASNLPGSHWIALYITKTTLEVFDPLGFKFYKWSRIPCKLFSFLHLHSTNRKLIFSKTVQSQSSKLCALFCIFYVLTRPFFSLKTIESFFSSHLNKNDEKLIKLF